MTGDLSRRLRPFRRRDARIRFAQATAILMPPVAALAFFAWRAGWPLLSAVAPVLLAGASASAAVAITRRRSTAALATAIDRRHGLNNRIAAALEHQHATDPVAALLRRDAAARLETITPAASLPFERPSRLVPVLVASALLAVAALFVPSTAPAPPQRESAGRASGGGDASPNVSGSSAESGTGERSAEAPAADTRRGATPGQSPTASVADPVAARSVSGRGAATTASAHVRTAGRGGGAAPPPPSAPGERLNARGAATGATGEAGATGRAGGISASASALPTAKTSGQALRARADRRLLTSEGASALTRDELPPALQAYVLRYLESIR